MSGPVLGTLCGTEVACSAYAAGTRDGEWRRDRGPLEEVIDAHEALRGPEKRLILPGKRPWERLSRRGNTLHFEG